MKTTLLTSIVALALTGMSAAQVLTPGNLPAGVTVSGDIDTTSSQTFFGIPGYALGQNQSITFDFGRPITGSFDLIDVDTATGNNSSGEEVRLQVDSGATMIVAGPATSNIPNNQAAQPQNIVTVPFSGQTITISSNNFGDAGAFAISNVTIPEPSSALLFGLGSLALLRRKR